MCRPLREVGTGVNDLHCSATHSRGVFKPGNTDHSSQSITSSEDIKLSNWTAAEHLLDLCSCLVLLACCCVSKLNWSLNPVLNSNGVQCKSLILKSYWLSLFTAQLPMFMSISEAAFGANVPPFLSQKGFGHILQKEYSTFGLHFKCDRSALCLCAKLTFWSQGINTGNKIESVLVSGA